MRNCLSTGFELPTTATYRNFSPLTFSFRSLGINLFSADCYVLRDNSDADKFSHCGREEKSHPLFSCATAAGGKAV